MINDRKEWKNGQTEEKRKKRKEGQTKKRKGKERKGTTDDKRSAALRTWTSNTAQGNRLRC